MYIKVTLLIGQTTMEGRFLFSYYSREPRKIYLLDFKGLMFGWVILGATVIPEIM